MPFGALGPRADGAPLLKRQRRRSLEGEGNGEGFPTSRLLPILGSGEAVSSLNVVRGGAPAKNSFGAFLPYDGIKLFGVWDHR